MRSDFDFFCEIRVRFNEIDIQGVVFNGNYSIYTDVALEAFFESKGYPYHTLHKEYDSEISHRKTTIDFLSSAFYGDVLEVGVRLLHLGNKSFTLRFEIYRKGEDTLLTSVDSVYVGYDSKNRCSKPITDLMRKILTS